MQAAERGHTRWGIVLPFLALPVVVLGVMVIGLFLWAWTDDDDAHDGTRAGAAAAVPCTEALAFGAAARPANARVDDCTVQRGIDTSYAAVLRMPREDVRDWLRQTYPNGPEARAGGGACGVLCLDVTHENGLPGTAEAHVVQVRVEYENAETALVRFSAFTM
ncbi:hypothetical protein ACPCBX_33760 [Streptomyces tuirus]|uniref:Uncharacterized protein n=1 Tax=Streptomyces tuirus TaxID=68278 RepID=A0A7G1NL95_9ACTN|nr:hypothetical protein [Streptomyces tuirus]BCL21895.1 hypothetical protein GCM10017668_37380 [Streptomyces tuirus]